MERCVSVWSVRERSLTPISRLSTNWRRPSCRRRGHAQSKLPRRLAERMHCPAFTSYEEMYEEMGCDAVVVSTPPITHPEICCWLLERGDSRAVRKTAGDRPDEAQTMVAAAERSEATLQDGLEVSSTSATSSQAKSIIASGLIGEIVLFENAFTSRIDMSSRWNSDPVIAGGGVLDR